jgi:MYND finger
MSTISTGQLLRFKSTMIGNDRRCQVCGRRKRRLGKTERCMNQNSDVQPTNLLRCTRCKNVHYCSIHCQRQDWKSGHRQSCRRAVGHEENGVKSAIKSSNESNNGKDISNLEGPLGSDTNAFVGPKAPSKITHRQAHVALKELCVLAQGTPLADSYNLARQAQEEMEHETERQRKQTEQQNRERRIRQQQRQAQQQQQQQWIQDKGDHSQEKKLFSDSTSVPQLLPTTRRIPSVSYVVEEMPRIRQYQLTLWVPSNVDTNNLSVSAQSVTPSGTFTLITILEEGTSGTVDTSHPQSNVIFTGEFPRSLDESRITCTCQTTLVDKSNSTTSAILNSPSISSEKKHEIHIRLPFSAEMDGRIDGVASAVSHDARSHKSTLKAVNGLVCGTCQLPILIPRNKISNGNANEKSSRLQPLTPPQPSSLSDSHTHAIIQRIKLLPKGNWDEIADYLICYSGVRRTT